MRFLLISTIFYYCLFIACSAPLQKSVTTPSINKPTKAAQILDRTIQAHGGNAYKKAHYQFVFREKNYTFKNDDHSFEYIRSFEDNGERIQDILNNNGFKRTINGKKISLSDKDIAKYTEAVNSVIYFATLPYKLQDPAVNLAHKGTTTIKGKSYDILSIHFEEENGGVDHDDEFHYWINQTTNRIDYLAYNYQTNNGGVRFRSAYNTRVVDGIVFQDYINFKAPVGTPLVDLPALLGKETLKELSLIETEAVVNLRKAN